MNVSLRPIGIKNGKSIEVESGYLSIGRSHQADLQLDHGMVSRHHAELIVRTDGVVVRDLESSNGTFVNGEPVNTVRRLRDGDVVSFSVVSFEVSIERGIRDRYRLVSPERLNSMTDASDVSMSVAMPEKNGDAFAR